MSGPLRKPPVTVTITLDPEEMARRGRIGGRVAHARHDSRELSAAGRAAFLARFATDEERRAYFLAIGRKGAEARRTRAEGNGGADAAS